MISNKSKSIYMNWDNNNKEFINIIDNIFNIYKNNSIVNKDKIFLELIKKETDNCDILIKECYNDLDQIFNVNTNSISNNKIKTIEELKNYYFINIGISKLKPGNYGYNAPIHKIYYSWERNERNKNKNKKVLYKHDYNKLKDGFKKFYKLTDITYVNKEGYLWDSKKTVQKYVIKNDNTFVYLINLYLCDLLITYCITLIGDKKNKIVKDAKEFIKKLINEVNEVNEENEENEEN